MQTTYRQLTVALLLSSYLLATVSSFLHRGHGCFDHGGTGDLVAAGCGACCDHGVHPHGGTADAAERPSGWSGGESRPAHRHQSDQCLLCRFLTLGKTVLFAPDLTTVTGFLYQRIVVALPALRAVDLVATPDSRAPPQA